MNNNFEEKLNEGKETEKLIATLLISKGFEVEDMSDVEEYQAIDTDFLIHKKGTWTMEIKSDSRIGKTGNIFLEVGMSRSTGFYEGWFNKCESDYMCIYDTVNSIAYMLDWDKTKKYAKSNGRNISFWNYTDNCQGYGILLSLDKAKENGLIEHVYNTEDINKIKAKLN